MTSLRQRLRPAHLRLTREAALFALVGGVQLGVDWLTFVVLTWLEVDVTVANIAGRMIGALLGFWLNARYTFQVEVRNTGHRFAQIARFVAGWCITAVLSTVAVFLIERHLGLHAAWIGKMLVDASIAALGFVLSKYWIFR